MVAEEVSQDAAINVQEYAHMEEIQLNKRQSPGNLGLPQQRPVSRNITSENNFGPSRASDHRAAHHVVSKCSKPV